MKKPNGNSILFQRDDDKSWSDTFDHVSKIAKIPANFDTSKLTEAQWQEISKSKGLSFDFVSKHFDKLNKLNKENILRHQPINDEIIEKYFLPLTADILDPLTLNSTIQLSDNFFEKHLDEIIKISPFAAKILLKKSLMKHLISSDFINKNWDKIMDLTNHKHEFLPFLPIESINQHINEFSPTELIQNVKLPKDLFNSVVEEIEEQKTVRNVEHYFCNDIDSPNIKYINEQFIINHPLIFNSFYYAGQNVKLSEEFLLKYIKKFDPEAIENLLNNPDGVNYKTAQKIKDKLIDIYYYDK